MKSNFLKLNKKDLVKGFIMAILTPLVYGAIQGLQTASLYFNWKELLTASLVGALSYLSKNLLSNSEDNFLKKERKLASKEIGDDEDKEIIGNRPNDR